MEQSSLYHRGHASLQEALALFDALAPVETTALRGRYRGAGFHTGHRLDGLLEAFGWYGKEFVDDDHVHPLLFGDAPVNLYMVDPARLPLSLALSLPTPKFALMKPLFRWSRPLFGTSQFQAHLRMLDYRGQRSAAMIYDTQPIVDHMRALDERNLLGLMELSGSPAPLFFRLTREHG